MRLFLIISSLIVTFASILVIAEEGISWISVGGMILFGGGALLFIFENRCDRWISELRKTRIRVSDCIIKDDHFYFPKGYYFRYGILKSQKELPFHIIKEIRTNTFPITAVVNDNEIIFLRGLEKKDINIIQERNIIPIREPQDNWALICEEFLDTEIDNRRKERTLDLLATSGIHRNEVYRIRKRFQFRMLLKTSLSWEWLYYGQFDVLGAFSLLTKKKYWWTMDIALRREI